jgi:hypothetical protein
VRRPITATPTAAPNANWESESMGAHSVGPGFSLAGASL